LSAPPTEDSSRTVHGLRRGVAAAAFRHRRRYLRHCCSTVTGWFVLVGVGSGSMVDDTILETDFFYPY